MKKTSFYVQGAALILAIAAFVCAKANKKYRSFTSAITASGVRVYGDFTTVAGDGCAVYFVTADTYAPQTLFTAVYRNKQAFLKCH